MHHPRSTHLPVPSYLVPSYLLSALATSHTHGQKKIKQISKQKPKHKNHLVVEAAVYHSASHSTSLCPHILTCKNSLQWVIGLIGALWVLWHHQYWVLTGTPPSYPVVALCHGDPAALEQQDWPFHVLQRSTDDVGSEVGLLKALDLDLGCSWPGEPAGSLNQYHQGKLSNIAQASPSNVDSSRRQGQPLLLSCPGGWLTRTHASRASSTVPPSWVGYRLPCATASEEERQLSQSHHPNPGASSPDSYRRRSHHLPASPTPQLRRGGASTPLHKTLGSYLHPGHQGQLCQGAGPASPNGTAGERQGQLSWPQG
jgi:hypothetical protein